MTKTIDYKAVPFSLVRGRSKIYSRIGKMISQSFNTLYIVTTIDDIENMFQTTIPEKISFAKNRGVEIRVLIGINNDEDLQTLHRINTCEIRVGKIPLKGRIIVEEKNELLMSGKLNNTQSFDDDSDSSLNTNSNEMISNMFDLCSLLWKKSKKLKFVMNSN